MKIVLFDLGKTLELNDVLLPGAKDALRAIQQLKDSSGRPPQLGLVSDFFPGPQELVQLRNKYLDILDNLSIRSFFEPVDRHVTISTDLVSLVFKPDERVFRLAIDRINPAGAFGDTMFITERLDHVVAARDLGMKAIHFQGPGQTTGDVRQLIDLVPLIRAFVET